jgi:demethylmenaquinone methyltransferase / 2-methoxy-6-polyprenyl-1,4-benzoquinol methylase
MKARDYHGPDSRRVQQMFAGIAHRYDFLNHFLSASTDRLWRNTAVRKVRHLIGISGSPLLLDACSGTGDLAIALQRGLGGRVIASDFCHPMLTRAQAKVAGARLEQHVLSSEADALALPFPDRLFDGVTIAFGLRNLEDPERGLSEMHRVLKPGGALIVLEFSKPVIPVFRHLFALYFKYVLPTLGAAISGDVEAYRYLPDSVSQFPAQAELLKLITGAGFEEAGYRNLTGGIAALHWGRKSRE